MTALFAYPAAAKVGAHVPRERLFSMAGGGKAIRELYKAQVRRIVWAHKLFPASMNLPVGETVSEVQVIEVRLHGDALDDRVLAHIDKALPQHTMFELTAERGVMVAAAFKRANEAESGKMVALGHTRTDWMPTSTPRAAVPPAASLDGLYAALLRALWRAEPRPNETLRAQAERLSAATAQAKTVARLEGQVRRQKDFAKQVELNRALRAAKKELAALS